MCLVGLGMLIHLTREHGAAGHDEGLYAIGDNKLYSQHADDLSGTDRLSTPSPFTFSFGSTAWLTNRKIRPNYA